MTATDDRLAKLIHAFAGAFAETAAKVSADARNTSDPVEAARLRGVASKGYSIASTLGSRAEKINKQATRTGTPPRPTRDRVAEQVGIRRTAVGRPAVSPFDDKAPVGTVRRRIAAHNALLDVAQPGRDRICGIEEESYGNAAVSGGPCVLKEGHHRPGYDDSFPRHMDAEQMHRAERYLIHSDPDPKTRA